MKLICATMFAFVLTVALFTGCSTRKPQTTTAPTTAAPTTQPTTAAPTTVPTTAPTMPMTTAPIPGTDMMPDTDLLPDATDGSVSTDDNGIIGTTTSTIPNAKAHRSH